MNPKPTWLAAMLLLCPLAAQEEAAPAIDAATRLKQLEAEYRETITKWQTERREAMKAAKKAEADGKPIPAMSMRPDFSALVDKHLAAAKDYSGDGAVEILLPVLRMSSDKDKARQVIDQLLEKHLDSTKLAQIGGMLPFLGQMVDEDYAKAAIAKIEKHGKNHALLGWVAFAKHEDTFRKQSAKSDEFKAAKTIVAKAVEQSEDSQLKRQFDQLIAEQEKFGMGMVAPDIVGTDLDGVDFKLSDYKGKVVFLDFWGDW